MNITNRKLGMRFRRKLGIISGSLAVLSLGTAPMVSARTTQQNKTLGSATDVYRIEIRKLSLFKVLETGDSDGTGELDQLKVNLASYSGDSPPGNRSQNDGYTEDQTTLINRTLNVGAGSNPVDIRVDDFVTFGGRAVPAGSRDLWIHSRRITPDGNLVTVSLFVTAHERDCAGNRNCRRGSSGSFTIEFNIPQFAAHPSQTCGPDNTFKMQPVDDHLQIVGIQGVATSSSGRTADYIFPVLTKHKKGGVRLMPFNAEICIASTKLP